ncbi:MAG: Asp23/Gls24 family envelope stress response protein [Massiliimalia sp.]|jgi:uncharacterized alkaline shock family protein YloU
MIRYENHLGVIDVSHDFFVNLVGSTVVNCFGVAGMAATNEQKGLLGFLRKNDGLDRGVKVRVKDDALTIELHIIVTYGTNISAIVKSIMNKVTYYVEEITGFRVERVHVFVDGMKSE